MRGKRRLIPTAAALLIAALLLAAGSSAAPPILVNGDFESGDKTGWFGYGCRLEIVSNDVYSGKYACRAWLDQEWGGGHHARFNVPNGRYRLVMRVKVSPGLDGKCTAGADKFGGAKTSIPIKHAGVWTEISFEIRVKNASGELYTWGPKTANGWILLDEVSIQPVT